MDRFFQIVGQITIFILAVFIITKIYYYFKYKKRAILTYRKNEDGSVEPVRTEKIKNICK